MARRAIALAGKDGELVRPKWLAQQMGLSEEEFRDMPKVNWPDPDPHGNYPFGAAIEAAFEHLRAQRQFATAQELASIVGVTQARMYHLAEDGYVIQTGRGRFDRAKSLEGLIRFYKERIGEGRKSATAIRNESLALDNEIKKLQLNRLNGECIDVKSASAALANRVLTCRERLLRIANKFAPRAPYLNNEVEVETELRRLIEEALEELSKPIDWAAEDGNETQEMA